MADRKMGAANLLSIFRPHSLSANHETDGSNRS
jgi:hypothetical protein